MKPDGSMEAFWSCTVHTYLNTSLPDGWTRSFYLFLEDDGEPEFKAMRKKRMNIHIMRSHDVTRHESLSPPPPIPKSP